MAAGFKPERRLHPTIATAQALFWQAEVNSDRATFQTALAVEQWSKNVYFANEQILPGQVAYFFNRSEIA
jgi:hypothetical protein